jgi:hypothetical protein
MRVRVHAILKKKRRSKTWPRLRDLKARNLQVLDRRRAFGQDLAKASERMMKIGAFSYQKWPMNDSHVELAWWGEHAVSSNIGTVRARAER